ncbi:hypothetical protein GCM10020227_08470 [Streptomyces flavovirens]
MCEVWHGPGWVAVSGVGAPDPCRTGSAAGSGGACKARHSGNDRVKKTELGVPFRAPAGLECLVLPWHHHRDGKPETHEQKT